MAIVSRRHSPMIGLLATSPQIVVLPPVARPTVYNRLINPILSCGQGEHAIVYITRRSCHPNVPASLILTPKRSWLPHCPWNSQRIRTFDFTPVLTGMTTRDFACEHIRMAGLHLDARRILQGPEQGTPAWFSPRHPVHRQSSHLAVNHCQDGGFPISPVDLEHCSLTLTAVIADGSWSRDLAWQRQGNLALGLSKGQLDTRRDS